MGDFSKISVNADKVRIEMARSQIGAYDLAEKAGISAPRFYNAMKKGCCSPDTLGRIAAALGVDPEDLIG